MPPIRFPLSRREDARLIDLHCHSDASDGTLTPAELVDLAVATGLQALAITDHDTFEGYDAARPVAVSRGLALICGVEVGARLAGASRSAHILGYFFQDPGAELRDWLLHLQVSRRERNVALLERLQENGIRLSWDDLVSRAPRQMGRPHFAQAMVSQGYVRTLQEAFDLYLSEDGVAWTDRDEPPCEEAISRIVNAGGVACLAHPVRLSRDAARMREILSQLIPAGLGGLECHHTEHTPEDTRLLLALASDFRLVVTGGSDFHGVNKPGVSLGTGAGNVDVPASVLDKLQALCGSVQGR